jgi:hypothetical protein
VENKKNKLAYRNVINNIHPHKSSNQNNYYNNTSESTSNNTKITSTQETQSSSKKSHFPKLNTPRKTSVLHKDTSQSKDIDIPHLEHLEALKKTLEGRNSRLSASARNSIKIAAGVVQMPTNKRASLAVNLFGVNQLSKKNQEDLENFINLLGSPLKHNKNPTHANSQKDMMDSKMLKIRNEKKTKMLEELYEKLKTKINSNHSISELKNYFTKFTNKSPLIDKDFE